jgi:hypothetical protein
MPNLPAKEQQRQYFKTINRKILKFPSTGSFQLIYTSFNLPD